MSCDSRSDIHPEIVAGRMIYWRLEMAWLWVNKRGPHPTPEWAYEYMFGKFQVSLASWLCVEQITFERGALLNLIRIFDPAKVPQGVDIEDFASLDQHPELILFEGSREKKSGKVKIERGLSYPP